MSKTRLILLLCVTVLLASCQKDDSPVIPVSGITISKTALSMNLGKKELLTATVTPVEAANKSVIWTSDNTKVATVSDKGEVTAVEIGTAIITVTSAADNTQTASCVVSVSEEGVGDFYMKDGSVISKDATLTNKQKANCIGIVFKMGRSVNGSWVDDCDYKLKDGTTPMTTVKGYVLALHDANKGGTCQWGTMEKEIGTYAKEPIGFYGYKNTQAIKQAATVLMNDYPATYLATAGYEAEYNAPANSSGWFLPSAGECQYWINHQETILASIRKVTDQSYNWLDYYWSSSEYSDYAPSYALFLHMKREEVRSDSKDANDINVRACLTF